MGIKCRVNPTMSSRSSERTEPSPAMTSITIPSSIQYITIKQPRHKAIYNSLQIQFSTALQISLQNHFHLTLPIHTITMPRQGDGSSDNGPIETGSDQVHGTSGDVSEPLHIPYSFHDSLDFIFLLHHSLFPTARNPQCPSSRPATPPVLVLASQNSIYLCINTTPLPPRHRTPSTPPPSRVRATIIQEPGTRNHQPSIHR
jgi:hypothetical protein